MVDTAVFGFFHRARIVPEAPQSPVPPPVPPMEAVARQQSVSEALSEPQAPVSADAANVAVQPEAAWEHRPVVDGDAAALPDAPTNRPSWNEIERVTTPAPADQLGLANPAVISVFATLPGSKSVGLDASACGLYRPPNFRAAPWSGFAYDQTDDTRTGVAAGTRILTSRGELEVEKLLPGDAALALRGPALLPIFWIGRTHSGEPPVWIEAGALGPNLPRRDLCLASDQAMFLDPEPVAARSLVNGVTIRRLESTQIDLFQIDVGKADVLFAEGVPLASGSRSAASRGP